jgi:D-xylose transport system permease protein
VTGPEATIAEAFDRGEGAGSPPPDPRRVLGHAVRLAEGERGALPVLVGLAAIWAIFQVANPRFLSPGNLTNLMLQITTIMLISVGVVLVLLLGEIDLSVGAVSGLCAAVMAVLNVKHGVGAPVALATGILTGAAVGALHGLWVTRLRVPSFVVTLAGLLAWQGALLYVLGDTGTLNITDPAITRLAGTFCSAGLGWAVAAFVVAGRGAVVLGHRRRRAAAGLPVPPPAGALLPLAATAGVTFGAVSVFNADRGLPLAVMLSVAVVLAFDVLVTRTRFGRHLLAIGGNAEAARRAGIPVDRIRVGVFIIASALAAVGGIMGAARLLAVNQSSGSGDLLLNAIAAAVIGGTSLFGGRGSAWSALLGALVIGSTSNGMDLLAVSPSVKFMVTGAVLLVAATVDSSSRRRRIARGLR